MPGGPSLLKCPYCYSLNVEPIREKLWHCGDCGKDFSEAVVEEVLPEEKKKK